MQKAVCLLGAAVILVLTSSISAQFYYGSNGPVPLSIDSNKVLIKFDMTYNPELQSAILSQIERIATVVHEQYVIDDFVCCSLSTGVGYTDFLDSLNALTVYIS